MDNAKALLAAIRYCHANGIGAFRVNSQILPLKTHPAAGYDLRDLPDGDVVEALFRTCGKTAQRLGIRLSFHPDQFVVPASPNPETAKKSIAELLYQAEVAEWIGADVINIHGGGMYGDKAASLRRLGETLRHLPFPIKKRITLENDDRIFTPKDLLPVCEAEGIPLVYDLHHHRCLPDGLSPEAAVKRAIATWNREPLFHLSSPREGWGAKDPKPHHDFIDPSDFPEDWKHQTLTIDVEAKAKEEAVLRLKQDLGLEKGPWQGFPVLLAPSEES